MMIIRVLFNLSVYMDGTDITNYAYIEPGTASSPQINFNVLTDVGII